MKKVVALLPEGDFWFQMWLEFESRIGIGQQIFELDKICPCIQAIEYQRKYKNHNLEQFYPHARSKLRTQQLIDLLDEMIKIKINESISPYEIYFRKLKNLSL